MVRPISIVVFDKLMLASILLSLISAFLNYGALREFAIANGTSPGAQFIFEIAGVLFNFLFWFLIARRASNIAKWIFVVLMGLSVVGMGFSLDVYLSLGTVYAISVTAITVLQLLAAIFLFRADAAVWLKSGGANGAVSTQVFE